MKETTERTMNALKDMTPMLDYQSALISRLMSAAGVDELNAEHVIKRISGMFEEAHRNAGGRGPGDGTMKKLVEAMLRACAEDRLVMKVVSAIAVGHLMVNIGAELAKVTSQEDVDESD